MLNLIMISFVIAIFVAAFGSPIHRYYFRRQTRMHDHGSKIYIKLAPTEGPSK